MTREEIERMKRAISHYHIQSRKEYSGNRRSIMEEELQKRKEAIGLVKQL
jgi:hypothetical protein